MSFDEGTLGKLINALVQETQMTKENLAQVPLRMLDHMCVEEEEWADDANMLISQEEDGTQLYDVWVCL